MSQRDTVVSHATLIAIEALKLLSFFAGWTNIHSYTYRLETMKHGQENLCRFRFRVVGGNVFRDVYSWEAKVILRRDSWGHWRPFMVTAYTKDDVFYVPVYFFEIGIERHNGLDLLAERRAILQIAMEAIIAKYPLLASRLDQERAFLGANYQKNGIDPWPIRQLVIPSRAVHPNDMEQHNHVWVEIQISRRGFTALRVHPNFLK